MEISPLYASREGKGVSRRCLQKVVLGDQGGQKPLLFTYPACQIPNQWVDRSYYQKHEYKVHESVAYGMWPAIYIEKTIDSE